MSVHIRRSRTRLAALAGIAAFALAGTRPSEREGGEEIAIAVGAPLSGQYARAGQETLHAVQIAVDEANADGGIDGRQIKVVQGDDQGDPQGGQSVAQKFCDDDGVLAVVGHYNSGVTIPASNVYAKCDLAQVSPLSSNPEVTERGLPNVFRVGARDDYMGPAVAAYIADQTDMQKVSTIDDQSAYGVGLVQQFTETAEARGLEIVKRAAIKAGDKDFRAVLGTLPKETQVVYFGGYPSDAALLAQQAEEIGLDVVLAGGDGLYDPDFLKGGDAVEASILAASAGIPSGGAEAFLTAYEEQYGEPSGYGLLEYNAARLVIKAMRDAEELTRQGVIDSLRTVSYVPVQGGDPIAFDPKGDNKNAQVHVFVVKEQDFAEVAVIKPGDFQ